MSSLPSYLAAAKPVPASSRAPWYKTVMPTYIGVMLWFVFWQSLVNAGVGEHGHPAGVLAYGFGTAFLGLIIAAMICHFLFYLVPGLLGMRTGLPLYVVGTSTYGASGGRFMPGFLMGILQFGWLAVNGAAVAGILCKCFGIGMTEDGPAAVVMVPGWPHGIIAAVFIIVAAFVGLKGIKYVAGVATYLPLIPVVILLGLLAITVGSLSGFTPEKLTANIPANSTAVDVSLGPMSHWDIVAILSVYIVGFFATAGAAGVDIASNCRNDNDVHTGGVTGIFLPTVLAGYVVMLIIAGAYNGGMIQAANIGNYNPVAVMPDILQHRFGAENGKTIANIAMIALAISSFPGACFSSLIAANSFKTTLPKVNPFVSVGVGALAAVLLAVSGWAGQVLGVFVVIGASFGPVCGAMLADFLLAGRKWSGPRASFNPAGWISWIVGFAVGAFNLVVQLMVNLKWDWASSKFPHLADYQDYIPVPPVTAFVVGFALYVVLSVIGVRTRKLLTPEGKLID
jgi:cytosine permease